MCDRFILLILSTFFSRTKWKRQTAVGLELLAEAGNYAAVQRMLQSNPGYWSAYGIIPTPGIMSNLDAMYLRHASGNNPTSPGSNMGPSPPGMSSSPPTPTAPLLPPQRPVLPRLFIQGLQQHVNHLPPPQTLYGSDPRS